MINRIAPTATENHTRLIAFWGSREDALERLPSVCPQERLEFGTNRISLVSHRKRVDLLILAELEAAKELSTQSMMLVELHFNASSVAQADDFVQCLQRNHGNQIH